MSPRQRPRHHPRRSPPGTPRQGAKPPPKFAGKRNKPKAEVREFGGGGGHQKKGKEGEEGKKRE